MKILVLSEKELRECVRLDKDVLSIVEDAFTRLSAGEATVPPILMIPVPERRGEVDVKAAYIRGFDSLAVKIASGFFENSTLGLPSASGMMVVLDARTGFPQAVLLDNGYLTQVRTGAAGAAAARLLAPERVESAGVIGAGTQARYQMQALKLVRDFRTLRVWSPVPAELDRYVPEMARLLGVEVVAAGSPEEVVRASQVVVTTTPARQGYLKAEWLHPGLHVTAMGADTEEKQELEPEVLARADLLACDLKSQCLRLGELHHAVERGLLPQADGIVELGELTSGKKPGRTSPEQITVCDLTGVGVQDTAIALLAYQRAAGRGLGHTIES